ncbi:hypothetical protein KOM00_03560 [Geomonas sp. Red69]|uniref:hypothetical protein n=1 Tax=Geomonas diazotrophica TaxID=2843197 RepID=UPI001C0F3DCB|nr:MULTISPECIES: hypothetical protein [Geomonas]MBU5635801.1 hypothetical protein [Geomonas diazotrophica]QXE87098.1 hypothetical protein KP003_01430 [Geomonas nitrogeniifigens]
MKLVRTGIVIFAFFVAGCAVLASNPYYEPSASVPVVGSTGRGGPVYLRFGGQNMIMTTGKPVDVGVKSGGYIGGYVPMAMGPILPVFPLFLTPPDQPDPMILLQLYIRPHVDDLVLNPKAITVKNSKGVTFSPVRVLGPLKPHSIPLNVVDVTYDKEEALRPGGDIQINKGKASCFLLQYDMASSPDWNISMQVDGIKVGSRAYPPDEFRFRRGSAVYLIWGGREELCADVD